MRPLSLLSLFLLLPFSSLAHDDDDHPLPRPLIIEYPQPSDEGGASFQASSSRGGTWSEEEVEVRLRCDSWRVAGEANNLAPWRTVPRECAGYVEAYMTGRGYQFDLDMVYRETGAYAGAVSLAGDGGDAWVFDVDETLLSNLPYYADHRYGLELFDRHQFDKWVEKANAPAIESSLKLYNELLDLGYKIILLTGRSEGHRSITIDNLRTAGFKNWEKLILRGVDDRGKSAAVYKSEKREELMTEGYRIIGNSGDQWSDLLGSSLSNRSFKLPNPMYYIP
uniref:Acid phosphatase 1 n=1 Tax=Anthurium amnicola TaxID=1678845 RepID=A0A1D1XM66_9ARAE